MSFEKVEIGTATLYRGDCLEIMPMLADKSVDAVITDPPYGINHNTDYKFTNNAATQNKFNPIVNDDKPFDPRPFLKFETVCFWGYNCFSDKLPIGALLIWLKKMPGKFGSIMSDGEVAWVNHGHGVYVIPHEWDGFIRASERGEPRQHPTQKPVEIMSWIIDKYTRKQAVVFDPFMGSGTTGVACAKLGRKFIGVEISQQYFDIACKRIEAAQAQMRMEFTT